MENKKCCYCRKLFLATRKSVAYCSEMCNKNSANEKRREKRAAENPKRVDCFHCGKKLGPLARKFCSEKCGNASYQRPRCGKQINQPMSLEELADNWFSGGVSSTVAMIAFEQEEPPQIIEGKIKQMVRLGLIVGKIGMNQTKYYSLAKK